MHQLRFCKILKFLRNLDFFILQYSKTTSASPIGAMVASVLLYCRFDQSTFYQKSASIECFYFGFYFVHYGNTSSTSTLPQADMLSISNDRTELANSRQILSKVEKD